MYCANINQKKNQSDYVNVTQNKLRPVILVGMKMAIT